jgi:hypothetical protein
MPYTSNKKINALDLAPAPLGDNDAVPMVRAGVTYQTPLSAVEAKVFSSKTALTASPLGTEVVILRQGDGSLRQTTTSSLIPDGNITNTQIGATAAIADTKLATIATVGKVSNSATTATSANTANAIVARDGSGNFSAGTIAAATSGTHTGPVVGNASTATALQTARAISMTGAVTATGVNFDGSAAIALNTAIAALPDSSLATITTAGKVSGNAITSGTIGGSTAINTSGTITSGTITANLTGNASTAAALQTARTIAISGDVTGTATSFSGGANITIASAITADSIVNADINSAAAIADTKLATISTAGKVANSATTATSANTANAIVARDASGNFSAGTITGAVTNLSGGSAGTVPYQSASGTTAMLAAGTAGQILQSNGASAPSWRNLNLLQTVYSEYKSQTGFLPTAALPIDNTIPQLTEGAQVMSLTITPVSAASFILLRFNCNLGHSNSGSRPVGVAMFDGSANAINARFMQIDGSSTGNSPIPFSMEVRVPSGSISARTYSIRAGSNGGVADTVFITGSRNAGSYFGGAITATFTAQEIL